MTKEWLSATKIGGREWEPFGFGFLLRTEAQTKFINFQHFCTCLGQVTFVFHCFHLSSPPVTQSKNLCDLNTL